MTRAERRWAVGWAMVVMLITCLPYLYVATLTPPGTSYSGLLHGVVDHCVYLSWQEQAAQGEFCIRNLFTSDPQRGIYVSLLSWIIGSVVRFTGLPMILAHHGARVLFGALTLVLAYRLYAFFTSDLATRRMAFWLNALSAGLGWLIPQVTAQGARSADIFQPEAITFRSLYFNGLFCAGLTLTLGVLILLLAAEGATGRRRWTRVIGAGVLGLLLGNIHSYDVITLTGAWGSYLLARALAERRFPGRALIDSLVAAVIASPSVLYQYYLYRTEPVFRLRADDLFLSPPLISYLVGYGLVFVLAVAGAVCLVRAASRSRQPLGQSFLPLAWAVVGFAIPYLPFAFQRKLIQGQHLPLAFLAAVGAMALVHCVGAQRPKTAGKKSALCPGAALPELSPAVRVARAALAVGIVLLTTPTLWVSIRQDIKEAVEPDHSRLHNRMVSMIRPPWFWRNEELEAMRWARAHLPKDEAIFCWIQTGHLIPAVAGRPVYAGHASETPDWRQRAEEAYRFYGRQDMSVRECRAFLEERKIRYVYCGAAERWLGCTDLSRYPFLSPIYEKNGVILYKLQPAATARRPARATETAF